VEYTVQAVPYPRIQVGAALFREVNACHHADSASLSDWVSLDSVRKQHSRYRKDLIFGNRENVSDSKNFDPTAVSHFAFRELFPDKVNVADPVREHGVTCPPVLVA